MIAWVVIILFALILLAICLYLLGIIISILALDERKEYDDVW